MSSDKENLSDWIESDECKSLVEQFRKGIKPEYYIGKISINDGNRLVELHDVVTDPDKPEDLEALLSIIQPNAQVVVNKTAQVVQHQPAQQSADTEQKLSDFIAPFLDDKKTSNRSNRYADAIKDAIENFIEFTGDIDPKLIQKDHARRFAKALETWPSNRRKKARYASLNIHQVLKQGVPKEDRISEVTYNNIIRKLSTFMIWLQEEKHISIDNPFSKLFKKEKAARHQWLAFTPAEVQQILSKPNLTFDPDRPSRYWVPMILAHSGARIEEICALYREDIQKDPDSGIWYLKIQNDKDDKSIKNDQSCRDVPIHSFLESVGLLDYVATIPAGTRLFPDLTYKEDFGYHDKISDHFTRYLKRIGVYQPKKTLKSFRHTVTTALYQTGATREIVPEIVGHSPDSGSMSLSRYHKGYLLPQKKAALEKIDWQLTV